MYHFTIKDQINTIKKYCNKEFLEYEKNILKIIESNLDDKLELIRIKLLYMGVAEEKGCFLLIDRNLLNIFENIDDSLFDIVKINDIKLKMRFIKKEEQYNLKDKYVINKFLLQNSILILNTENENTIKFRKYLDKNCENFSELLKYCIIIKNGWLKPKFNCVNILLNSFDSLKF